MGRVLNPQIENDFSYHAPKPGQPDIYELIRDTAKEFAYVIDETCPASRDRSVAFTKLAEVVYWANASIAKN